MWTGGAEIKTLTFQLVDNSHWHLSHSSKNNQVQNHIMYTLDPFI